MPLRYEIAVAEPQPNGTDTSTSLSYSFSRPLEYRENNRLTLESYAIQSISSTGVLSNRGNDDLPFIHINVYQGEALYGRYIASRESFGEGDNRRVVITGWVYYTYNKDTMELEKFVEKRTNLKLLSILMKVYCTLVILLLVLHPFFNGHTLYDIFVIVNNFFMILFIICQWGYLDSARKQYYKSEKYTPKRVMMYANIPVLGTSLLALLDSDIPIGIAWLGLFSAIVVMLVYLGILVVDEKQSTKL